MNTNSNADAIAIQDHSLKLDHIDTAELRRMVGELQQAKADLESKRYVEATLARFAALVRWQKEDDLESWVNRLLEEIVGAVNGLQACLYMTEDRAEGRFLRVAGAYAYHRESLEDAIPFGEGILGQAARSAKTQVYANIGDQFETRSYTGLAVFRPRTLLVQVLLYNEQVEGVLEISSLGEFTQGQLDLIRALSENIAANMMAIRNQEEVKRLYQEAQQKAEELLAQDEEMRQNMEELEATQEEMKRGQKELAVRESRLNGVLNTVSDGIVTIDAKGVIQSANPACERLFGYKLAEMLGQNIALLAGGEHAAKHDSYLHNYHTTGVAKILGKGRRVPGRRKDGTEFPIFLTVSELITPEGDRLYIGVVRDETERVRAEREQQEMLEQIRASEEELRQNLEEMTATQEQVLRTQNELALREARLNAVLNTVVDGIITIDELGVIQSANPAVTHILGYDTQELIGRNISLLAGGEHGPKHDQYLKNYRDSGIAKVMGKSRRLPARHKDGHEVMVYLAVSEAHVGGQRIFTGILRDVTKEVTAEREQQELLEQIRASEEELRQNLEEINAAQDQMKAMQQEVATKNADLTSMLAALDRTTAVIEFDLEGQVLRANPIFLSLMGYTESEIVGRHHRIFVLPEDRETERYLNFWKELQSGRPMSGEFCRLARDGSQRWILGSYNPVFDANGKLVKFVKFASDITKMKELQTEQRQMVESVQASEEELRQNLEEINATQEQMKLIQKEVAAKNADLESTLTALDRSTAVIEFSLDGQILRANNLFLGLMGYSASDVLGRHHSIFVLPAERQSADYKAFWEILRSGEPVSGEFCRVAADGSPRWILGSYNPVLDANGKLVRVVKFAQDITESKIMQSEQRQMMEEVQASEEELRQNMEEINATQEALKIAQQEAALRSADLQSILTALDRSTATIEFDPDGTIRHANANFLHLMGYTHERQIQGQHHAIFVLPDERDSADYLAFWAALRAGQPIGGEFCRLAADGSLRWISGSYNPVFDQMGNLVKIIKFANDITASKLLQAELENQVLNQASRPAPMPDQTDGASAADPELAAMLSAIDRANAVVEFDMDGNIIRANEKFLELVGYDAHELLNQPHHRLVPADEHQSPDYQMFWDVLRQGKSVAGQFVRRHKNGSDVWLNGHYHPVLGPDGQPIKVLKLASAFAPIVQQ